jgi:hypothetical protein
MPTFTVQRSISRSSLRRSNDSKTKRPYLPESGVSLCSLILAVSAASLSRQRDCYGHSLTANQTAPLRPVTRLITRTIRANTSSKWTKPPNV